MTATAAAFSRAPALALPQTPPLIHRIRFGDTISRLAEEYYDAPYGSDRYALAVEYLRLNNPQINDINRIRTGDMVRLVPLPVNGSCSRPEQLYAQLTNRSTLSPSALELMQMDQLWPHAADQEAAFWALALLEEHYHWLTTPAGIGLATFGNVLNQGNIALVREVEQLYEQYRRGHLTKGQYDGRRAQALKRFAHNVGPFERFVMGGKSTLEAVRINRLKSLPATHNIRQAAARLSNLSRLATSGGVILAGANGYMACRSMAATDNRQEKNEILVEAATSTLVGAFASVTIGAVLFTTPVGWGVALILAAGSAAVSAGAGLAATGLYNRFGNGVDYTAMLGLDRICE